VTVSTADPGPETADPDPADDPADPLDLAPDALCGPMAECGYDDD
jgi:hypothetical protein